MNLQLKRRRLQQPEMETDRLSELPEPLLVDILRRLCSAKEAAKTTSVLSKQWRFLWTNMSDLTFDNRSRDPDEIARLVAGVRAAVASTKASLERLIVNFCYDKRVASDVDAVLDATAERVKCLFLNPEPTQKPCRSSDRYTLPQAIYSHSQLRVLALNNCNVASPAAAAVGWRFMTQLLIISAELTQRAIDAIASGCPALRCLHLVWCTGFNRVEIGGSSFRNLSVRNCRNNYGGGEQLFEIKAPYMRELIVWMNPRSMNVRLTDASSLESARIDFSELGGALSDEAMIRHGKELFDNIRRVKLLTLYPNSLRVLIV